MSERATRFGRRVTATEAQLREMVQAALELEQTHGIPADQLLTLIGFETAGSYHPWQRGPTTRHGQHRGLIQWGEPQRREYGVHEGMPVRDQVMAAGQYLLDRGYKPGEHGVENMYAAILAGHANLIHRGDLHAGGVAPSAAVAAREMMDDEWATTRQLMNSFGSKTGLRLSISPTRSRAQTLSGQQRVHARRPRIRSPDRRMGRPPVRAGDPKTRKPNRLHHPKTGRLSPLRPAHRLGLR